MQRQSSTGLPGGPASAMTARARAAARRPRRSPRRRAAGCARRAVVGDDPRQDRRHLADRGRGGRAGRRLRSNRPMASRFLMVGKIRSNSPRRCALERVGRADPEVGDRLAVVVQRHLLGRRGGHEEAGVVAAGRALGRDPVAEVVHVGRRPGAGAPRAQTSTSRRSPVSTASRWTAKRSATRRRRGARSRRRRRRPAGRRPPRSTRGSAATQKARPPRSMPSAALASASVRPSQTASRSAWRSASSTAPPGNT